ncbi:MAG: helix-turn-helix transcriptional regulator [Tepidisphaerales bacterium]
MERAGVLPRLPRPDADGNRPALEVCNIIIARKFVSRRIKAGLTQKELARRAGVRLETICRVEGGKQRPSHETILRIDAALNEAESVE